MDLARQLCIEAKARGWVGLQTPFIPYFDPKPFFGARFVPFPKKLLVAAMPLTNVPLPKRVKSFYFDWR